MTGQKIINSHDGVSAPGWQGVFPMGRGLVHRVRSRLGNERGAVVIFIAIALVALLAMTAFVVDFGRVYATRADMQKTADAAALAAAEELPIAPAVAGEAILYGQLNAPGAGTVIAPSDVVVGHWDAATKTFFPGGGPLNAVRVTAHQSEANGNPLPMYFAGIVGMPQMDVGASAIATLTPDGPGSKFLIDDEMFDTDEPAIEAVAAGLPGVTTDDLLSDGDGDWFIDFYDLAGPITIELPTGQVGDEALFDFDHPAFPFGPTTLPSFTDFLNWNNDGSWREALIPSGMLDPLLGVDSVSDGSLYPGFVDASQVHVSPVFKSDVSDLGLIGGIPAVNALVERRGLVAFRIVGVGTDPDGAGSQLPNLVIQLVDPDTVSIGSVTPGTDGAQVYLVG